MALSTAGTFLKYSEDEGLTFVSLLEIINYPDLGSTPTKIDTTTLSAIKYKTSMAGLQELPDLVFEANYDDAVYTMIDALAGVTHTFQLQFGEEGVDGKFTWNGQVSVYPVGGGVDEPRKMQVSVSNETEIVAS